MNSNNPGPTFRVTLTSAGDRDPASAYRRLARALKALGRAHGFRAGFVEELPPPGQNASPGASQGASRASGGEEAGPG